MPSSKLTSFFKAAVALVVAINFFIPVYVLLADFPASEDVIKRVSNDDSTTIQLPLTIDDSCLGHPVIQQAGDGSSKKEEERLIRALTNIQTTCDHLELPGRAKQVLTTKREDLRWNSYLCVGGKIGLKKYECFVYSFGIKHRWSKFPELVERHLGCQVHVFDPAVDYIDHYYTRNVRFVDAKLSDTDKEAQYEGAEGWRYRRFLTLVKELHYTHEPIDLMRLDITLDLWPAMSTMLQDGSLLTYVKQLSFEYDLNKKSAADLREMYTITQWLRKQGFLLVHSQPTKLSGKSYFVLYLNTKTGLSQERDGTV